MGRFDLDSAQIDWVKETDEWLEEKLTDQKIDSLLQSPSVLPNFQMAAPTTEHFDPLYFVLGTLDKEESINQFHSSYQLY